MLVSGSGSGWVQSMVSKDTAPNKRNSECELLPRSHMTSALNFHQTLRKVFNDERWTVIYTPSYWSDRGQSGNSSRGQQEIVLLIRCLGGMS